MTVREYIGARYVPVFSDPIQWDNTKSYEPLTVVTNNGTSYVSRQSVPPGTAIDNESYWVRWADYNAQLEEYIRQVQTYNASITALNEALPIEDFDDENTVDARFDVIEANSWVTTDRIADGAVTSAKIANNTIKFEDLSNDASGPGDIVLIGDSYLEGYSPDGNTTSFGTIISNWLNSNNVNVYVKFRGGCGFAHAINDVRFAELLEQQANAMTETQRKKVKTIIASGGYNDSYSGADVNSGMTGFRNAVNSYFPNATKVIACFIGCVISTYANNPAYTFSDVVEKGLTNWMANGYTHGIAIVNAVNTIKDVDYMASDYVHPNQAGQNKLAQQVYSVICGVKPTGFNSGKPFTLSDVQGNTVGTASGEFRYFENFNNEWTQENVKCFRGQRIVSCANSTNKTLNNAIFSCKIGGQGIAGLQGSKQTGLVKMLFRGYPTSAMQGRRFYDAVGTYRLVTVGNDVYMNFYVSHLNDAGSDYLTIYGLDQYTIDWGSY